MDVSNNIDMALSELQKRLPTISKDSTAHVKSDRAQFSYNYADLAVISRAVLPLLGELGLSWVCKPTLIDGKFVLAYELRHTSGDSIEGMYPLPERGSPQEIGGAITYARRYCLCAVTGVAPDDDDTDAAAAEKAAKRQRRQASQAPEPFFAGPPMDAAQQIRIKALFEQLGMGPDARYARLKYATQVIGRTLKSATDMTHAEAAKVIEFAEKELADKQREAQDAEAPPSDQNGPSVERQRKRIMALVDELAKVGHPMDRDQRLAYYTEIVKRPVDSTNSLTFGEAEKVIATMIAFRDQQGG